MRRTSILLAGTALAVIGLSGAARAVPAIGLYQGTSLFTFDTTNPAAGSGITAISGLQANEIIFSIDFRPATGMLYALGSSQRLYTIDVGSGAATAGAAFSTVLSGTSFDVSFNPTVDRLRVVSAQGNNYRINVDTGAVTTDTSLAFNPASTTPTVTEIAYSGQRANNFGGTTTLLDLESSTTSLYTQAPPNNGTLNLVGSVIAGLTGFDIDGVTGTGYASTSTLLYVINAGDGSTGLVDGFGKAGVTDITLVQAAQVPEPMSLALLGMGIAGACALRRKRAAAAA